MKQETCGKELYILYTDDFTAQDIERLTESLPDWRRQQALRFRHETGRRQCVLAYEALHRSFDLALPLAPLIAVLSWLLGACGIWISGIPYHLRDAMRLAAEKTSMRLLFGLSLIACALLFAVSGIFSL